MATLQLPAHHIGMALRQAGADTLACVANSLANVVGYQFAGRRRDRSTQPGFGQAAGQSRHITFIAMQADVDGSPIELVADVQLDVDGETFRIAERSDDLQLGQCTLQLELAL